MKGTIWSKYAEKKRTQIIQIIGEICTKTYSRYLNLNIIYHLLQLRSIFKLLKVMFI